MGRIDEARAAWQAAIERMEDLALHLEGLPDNADEGVVAEVEERFANAEREAQRCKVNLDRLERIAAARSDTLPSADDARGDNAGDQPESRRLSSGSVQIVSEPQTYDRHNSNGNFYFRDVFHASNGDEGARARLHRHMREAAVELRALNSSDSTGGEFVPPIWLMEEYATVVRMGRPFATNVTRNMGGTPPNTDSISVPKLTTGSATATQADGGTVQNTDAASGSITVGIKTIAGEQTLSRQLFDRALPGADQLIFGDLIADYNVKLDIQTLSGGGTGANAKGVLTDSNRVQVTYTDTTSTVPEFYSKVGDAIQQITVGRGLPPDTITMHPRRWAWISVAFDSSGRPLIVPSGAALNQPGTASSPTQLGRPGFTFQGLEVVVDANLPTTNGAGTNEDVVVISRAQDNLLWEDPTPRTRVDESRASGNLQVVLQLWNYFGFTTERYSKANATIGGTGLVAPTF